MQPCLSVIIPVYNTEKYLPECLESIINQTFTDIEIILVDNVSTDRSGVICDEYARNDKRIKVIHRKEHGWVSDSRNDGIDIAMGKWITFVDSDDWLELDCYMMLFRELRDREVDIYCEGGYFRELPSGRKKYSNQFTNFDFTDKESLKKLRVYTIIMALGKEEASLYCPWDKLYRAEFLKSNELKYAEDVLIYDDNFFNYITFYRASRIAGSSYIGYHYRQVSDSICYKYRTECPERTFHFLERMKSLVIENETSNDIIEALQTRILISLKTLLLNYYFHPQNGSSLKEKRKEVREWKNVGLYKEAILCQTRKYCSKKILIMRYILRTPFIFPLQIYCCIINRRRTLYER